MWNNNPECEVWNNNPIYCDQFHFCYTDGICIQMVYKYDVKWLDNVEGTHYEKNVYSNI